jgi:hypothetical protein
MDPRQVVRDDDGVMRCTQCGFRYDHSSDEVAEAASAGLNEVRDAVRATPRERRAVRVAPDVWSVNAYTAHLAEASGVVLGRVRRIAEEDRPDLAWYDESESVERNRFDERSVDVSLSELEHRVNEFILLLHSLEPGQWGRIGVHSRAGDIRLAESAHDMAHELRHHAGDIRAIGVEGRVP